MDAVKCLVDLQFLPDGGFTRIGNNPLRFTPGLSFGPLGVFGEPIRQMPQMGLRGRRCIRTSIRSGPHLIYPSGSNHPHIFNWYRSSEDLCTRGFAEAPQSEYNTSDRSNPLAWTSSDALGRPHAASKGTTT